jgi:hypothetical protein
VHNESVQISVRKTLNPRITSKEDTMNSIKVNTIKFNNMNIKAPVGPGQQIPFRGNTTVQDPETSNTPKMGINKTQNGAEISNGANLGNTKKDLGFFGKLAHQIDDFVKLDNPDLMYLNTDRAFYYNYLA